MVTTTGNRSVAKPAKVDWGGMVKTTADKKPSRLAIHGPEGVGKTLFACQAPSPIYMMTRGETGLITLMSSGQTSNIAHFPETMTWVDALSQIEWLATAEHPHKTLVIDTINGLERLCHEHVCDKHYGGQWGGQKGQDGFLSFQNGYEVSLADWRELLASLDRVRDRGMSVILLAQTKAANFKNPQGPDYERYRPAMHSSTWGLTAWWVDVVGFLNFETFVEEEGRNKRLKGKGGQSRVMYTERHAAYDAKNRFSLPPDIDMGDSAAEGWANFVAAFKQSNTERKS